MQYKCPTCKKTVRLTAQESSGQGKFFPFCSQRCKLIDLGAWFNARYRIPSEPQPPQAVKPPDTSSDEAGPE